MSEEKKIPLPMEELFRFWQMWVMMGMDMLMRAPAFFAALGKGMEKPGLGREEIERVIQAALQAWRLPSPDDPQKMTGEMAALRGQVEAVQRALGAVEAALRLQAEGWKTLQALLQRVAAAQEEGQRALQAWRSQIEERVGSGARLMEEWGRRWEEALRQGMAFGQASQKGLEELTKTVWDLSKKVAGS